MPRGGARPNSGRPKGGKNRKLNLSGVTVAKICEDERFNPAQKLIAIARNDDWEGDKRIPWSQQAQHRATETLFNAVHNPKHAGAGVDDGDGKQYEIVFLESADDFVLPGEGSTESPAGVLPEAQIQRLGMPSADGKDGVCNQYDDTQGLDLSET